MVRPPVGDEEKGQQSEYRGHRPESSHSIYNKPRYTEVVLAVTGLLFLALGPAKVIFDGDIDVPRSRARGIPVKIAHPTYVYGKYETRVDRAQVRAALLTAADVQAFQEGKPHEPLADTDYAGSGEFRVLVMRPGDYFVLIDNRHEERASLAVHALVTGVEDPTLPRTLPASRRYAVTAISLTLFAVVAGWSGWRLRRTRLLG